MTHYKKSVKDRVSVEKTYGVFREVTKYWKFFSAKIFVFMYVKPNFIRDFFLRTLRYLRTSNHQSMKKYRSVPLI